eukprot:CAMPEP_0167740010 /NCGR_PEP_ID=MMETSP0110_2-20121227/38_1 /TAXON_ID=629695 /ORGANISM="Gymnochlora sp., Strain CCMP2014" /LENGTH=227 /DNA_ID=CAMNT_0007623853 /DNA_START=122 /DNA_END=805 /DNA_ORIENTATION=+
MTQLAKNYPQFFEKDDESVTFMLKGDPSDPVYKEAHKEFEEAFELMGETDEEAEKYGEDTDAILEEFQDLAKMEMKDYNSEELQALLNQEMTEDNLADLLEDSFEEFRVFHESSMSQSKELGGRGSDMYKNKPNEDPRVLSGDFSIQLDRDEEASSAAPKDSVFDDFLDELPSQGKDSKFSKADVGFSHSKKSRSKARDQLLERIVQDKDYLKGSVDASRPTKPSKR